MSASREHFWQYGIRCDHPGCLASLWRVGVSEQIAFTQVQADAKAAGWCVAADRLYTNHDTCPAHTPGAKVRR